MGEEWKFEMEKDKLVGVAGDKPPASILGDADRQLRMMMLGLPAGDVELRLAAQSVGNMVAVLECRTSLAEGVCGAECCRYEDVLWMRPLLLLTVLVLLVSTVSWWIFE